VKKPKLLIVGAGGVGAVAAQKAAQFHDEFESIVLASRSIAKPQAIAEDAQKRWAKEGSPPLLEVRNVNARDIGSTADFIRDTASEIVLNVASPYCNAPLMDACAEAGAHYIDTSVAEDEHVENSPAPWYEAFEWPRRPNFEKKGFDRIDTIDIIDVNGGDHGKYFATNFDPDTNLREIMEDVIYWEDGAFRTIPHHSKSQEVTLPEVGTHKVFALSAQVHAGGEADRVLDGLRGQVPAGF
jgi:saccharopine dehydrogenase-like NADP-dependent oxidoreductase